MLNCLYRFAIILVKEVDFADMRQLMKYLLLGTCLPYHADVLIYYADNFINMI